jgi:hypothetical protein
MMEVTILLITLYVVHCKFDWGCTHSHGTCEDHDLVHLSFPGRFENR